MSVVLSLVSGGGLPPVADPPGEPVDDAGTGALDAPLALAAGADRAAPGPALDVAGALALRAAAEREQVQPPHPDSEGGDDGQGEVSVHGRSPALAAAGGPGGIPSRPPLGVAASMSPGLADGFAFVASPA